MQFFILPSFITLLVTCKEHVCGPYSKNMCSSVRNFLTIFKMNIFLYSHQQWLRALLHIFLGWSIICLSSLVSIWSIFSLNCSFAIYCTFERSSHILNNSTWVNLYILTLSSTEKFCVFHVSFLPGFYLQNNTTKLNTSVFFLGKLLRIL